MEVKLQCKNCNKEIKTEQLYCSNCGGKIVNERLTIKGIWQEFVGPFFSWESNFSRTFRDMFTQPKELMTAYISGARKKYFQPFAYLVLYTTIAIFFYKFFPFNEVMDFSQGFNDGLKSANNKSQAKININSAAMYEFIIGYYNFIMVLIIPYFAYLTKKVFKKHGHNFSEHLVFNSYLHTNIGYFSLIIQLIVTNLLKLSYNYYFLIYILTSTVFSAHVFTKLYQLNTKQMLWSVFKFWLYLLLSYFLIVLVSAVVYSIASFI